MNFTRAAERLFLAQPSLSQQIRELESQLKFPIFERGGGGVRLTDAGRLVVAYAVTALRERDEIVSMARAIHLGEVPLLRLGFSSFVTTSLLQTFRESYEEMFPGCEIQLSSGNPILTLQRLSQRTLDCALLPMPIDEKLYKVHQIAQSPLVVCMAANDPLAAQVQVDIHEIAPRLKVFRDPELHPAAHSRLVELFNEVGISLSVANSGRTPSDIQWMVKANCGLALIDQLLPLDAGLVTRPIAGVNWTADTAFVHQSRADHIALPFIERFFQERWQKFHGKKHPSGSVRPEQLKLLG
ncbi:MAG: Chromosome initiation inhibitor [Edaphobacter sp.]|nr:Chromosome initiation inhibitor [Edaphobacter sp.]